MNENHMKTSVTTGEVSLRWAKKADQRAKSSENGPISPNCYLLGLRRRLDYGPRQQKYHENVGNNHLKTLNIRSNGKSRLIWFVATFKYEDQRAFAVPFQRLERKPRNSK